MKRRVFSFAAALLAWLAALPTARGDAPDPAANVPPRQSVVLENQRLRVVIDTLGGVITSLIDKSADNGELLQGPCLEDFLLLPGRRVESLKGLAFQSAALQIEGGSGVELTAALPAGKPLTPEQFSASLLGGPRSLGNLNLPAVFALHPFQNIRMSKRFTLAHDGGGLVVQYQWHNQGPTAVPLCLGSSFPFRRNAGQGMLCVPSRDGALQLPWPLDAERVNKLVALDGLAQGALYELPSAFAAVLQGNDGARGVVGGFAVEMAGFAQVDCQSGLVRLARNTVDLQPGQTLSSTAWLLPLAQMARVDGLQGGIAGGMVLSNEKLDGASPLYRGNFTDAVELRDSKSLADGENAEQMDQMLADMNKDLDAAKDHLYQGPAVEVRLQLTSVAAFIGELTWKARLNPAGDEQIIGQQKLELKPGQPARAEQTFRPKLKGTHVLRAELTAEGKLVAAFERAVIAGGRSGFFLPQGPPKLGVSNDEFRYEQIHPKANFPLPFWWQPSMEVATTHLAIARAVRGGTLSALVVCPYYQSRDVVELRQRFDVAGDVVVVGQHGYRKKWEGIQKSNMRQDASVDQIDQLRSFLNQKHEVIVLAGLFGDWFPPDVMNEICRQVEHEGVGLVLCQPEALTGALEKWEQQAKPAQGLPLTARARITQVGKGKVAIFDGDNRAQFGSWIGNSEVEFDEFAQVLLWAGRGPSELIIAAAPKEKMSRATLGETPLLLRLENQGKSDWSGTLRLTPRRDLGEQYPFYTVNSLPGRIVPSWQEFPAVEVQVQLPAGAKTPLQLTLPILPAGSYSLRCELRDEQAAVAAWLSFPTKVTADALLTDITVQGAGGEFSFPADASPQERLYFPARASETLQVNVGVRGAGAQTLWVHARDPWGRVLLDQRQMLPAGAKKLQLALPLSRAIHKAMILTLALLDDQGQVIHDRQLLGLIQPWDHREPAFHFASYSNYSLVNPEAQGYDLRTGAINDAVALQHAWMNAGVAEYGSRMPLIEKIREPGWEREEAPEAPKADMKPNKVDEIGAELDDMLSSDADRLQAAKKAWLRIPSLDDPVGRATAMEAFADYYRKLSFFGPAVGFLTDEWFYTKEMTAGKTMEWRRTFIPGRDTNIDRTPATLARFSAFMKELYGGDLSRLNQEWATKFTRWEDVDPPMLEKKPDCPPESLWPRILDHRRFINHSVADLVGEFYKTAKSVHPLAQVGLSGVWKTSIWSNNDIYLLAPYCEFNQLYRDFALWYSFSGRMSYQWVGYANKYSPVKEAKAPWVLMFVGRNGAAYYGKEVWPMLWADLRPIPGPKAMFDSMRQIRQKGHDRLIVGKQALDSVALYYDPISIFTAQMQEWQEDAPSFIEHMGNAGRSHNEFCHEVAGAYEGLLGRHVLSPYWVAYGELEKGSFGRHGPPRMLLLPYTQCLSDAQAAALEKYVREGGVLVGDVHTGFRDEHGKRRGQGALDAVFGIRQSAPGKVRVRRDKEGKPIPVQFAKELGGPFSLSFAAVGPGDVQATTAKALGSFSLEGKDQPAFLVNDYGKGKAIYLNFIPAGMASVLQNMTTDADVEVKNVEVDASAFAGKLLDRLLTFAQIPVTAKCEPGPQLYRFEDGAAQYLGLNMSYGNQQAWERDYLVQLTQPRHVYDSRDGVYVGLTDQFKVRFDGHNERLIRFYALLPQKIEKLAVEPAQSEWAAGQTLQFSIAAVTTAAAGPDQVHRAFAVELLDPQGNSPPWYRQCFESKDGGKIQAHVELALNEPPGPWKLRVTDAASGVSAEVPFTVK